MSAQSNLLQMSYWLWLGAVVVGLLFFVFNRSAQKKRKLWPLFLVTAGAFMFLFAWIASRPGPVFYTLGVFILLFVAVLSWVTKFCGQCGVTVFSRSGLLPRKVCPKCGATLR